LTIHFCAELAQLTLKLFQRIIKLSKTFKSIKAGIQSKKKQGILKDWERPSEDNKVTSTEMV
jgi:hypothetical protein